jgi:phosphohistidine phosphatase
MERDETFIVMLRHGIAEEHGTRANDDERELTETGHGRMEEIGRGLAELFPKAEIIYSSPLIRCVQTAEWVRKAYGADMVVRKTDALRPDASPAEFRSLIAASDARNLICVSHEPTLSSAMADLTGMTDGTIELKKGGCYGVRFFGGGRATLEWLLPPRVMRRA